MTVGLPGAGIGGLFYLLAALAMPIGESWRTVRGRSSLARWSVVLQQFATAGGIFAGTWVSGWLVAAALAQATTRGTARGIAAGGAADLQRAAEWMRPTHGIMQLATLALLMVAVWVLGALFARPRAARPVAAETTRHAEPVTPALASAMEAMGRLATGEGLRLVTGEGPRLATPGPHATRDLRIPTPMPWRQRTRRAQGE